MLDLMRKNAKNWLVKLLLGIIIIVFVFYFGSLRESGQANKVASFDGKVISYADFQQEYENLIELYRNRLGSSFNEEIIKALNLKNQAFETMINQRLMLAKADELGIKVTDEELKNTILSYPAFQSSGSFNQEVYQRTLRANRLTPENFETRQKNALIMEKIQKLISDGIHVSDREILDFYHLQNDQIKVAYLKLNSQNFKNQIQPAQEELQSYYDEHKNELRVPEEIQVKFLAFPATAYSAGISPSETEIRDYYERNKEKFAKEGQKPPGLEEVKGTVISELARIAGMARAAQEAKKAHDTIYQQENFTAYASEQGLKVQTSTLFSSANIPAEFQSLRDFYKLVFPLRQNETSRVMSDNQGYYIFQIAARKPAYIPDFKEAEQEVTKRYVAKEAEKLCRKKADELLERLKKGEEWNKIAEEENSASGETTFFQPAAGSPELGYSDQLSDALPKLSESNPYSSQAIADGKGDFLLLRFTEKSKFSETDYQEQKEKMKTMLLDIKKNEAFTQWLEGLKAYFIKEGRLKIVKDAASL